jgi:hypothetical protein
MKINTTYEDTLEKFLFYAKGTGWQEKVTEPQEVTDEDGNTTTEMVEVDNPYTLKMFVEDETKNLWAEKLATVAQKENKSTLIAKINENNKAIVEDIKSKISVTVE